MSKLKLYIIIIFIIIVSGVIFLSCANLDKLIYEKKWKLEEYDDWYFIVDSGEIAGFINYRLDRTYNENGEKRYIENTVRNIYVLNEGSEVGSKVEIKTTRSWLKLDEDLNILQFQFYSSPLYKGDTERFTRGIIEEGKLKISTNETELYEIEAPDELPSILNYRYIINNEDWNRGKHINYEFFSIKYLTIIEESIVYAGEEMAKYRGEWVLTDKYLIMPFENSEEMDSYYFNEEGKLILASLFQGEMYMFLATEREVRGKFKF